MGAAAIALPTEVAPLLNSLFFFFYVSWPPRAINAGY